MHYHTDMSTPSTSVSEPFESLSGPRQVSFDDEPLILVDAQDNVLGYRPKAECHVGDGVLHRAFSIFLFDAQGRLLIHRRNTEKPLWPGFWTNSCCSHPRRGETVEEAAQRRLREELGVDAELTRLYAFQYQARYLDVGSEHELCSVFIGPLSGEPRVNPTEIAQWRMISASDLDAALENDPESYTPWCRMEWQRLRDEFWPRVEALAGG